MQQGLLGRSAVRLRSRPFRFSLGMLLVVMTCLAGYLGGRKAGYDDGMQIASERKIYIESYDVASLVTPVGELKGQPPEFETLIDLIKTTVAEDTWDRRHGMYRIDADRANLRLLITQTEMGHREIDDLLEALRNLSRAEGSTAQN